MVTTQRRPTAWIDPSDIDPLANHLKRQSNRTRYRDSALIRLLADIGLKPGEIAGDNPETIVQVGDVSLSEPGDGRPSDPTPPTGGCVRIRREIGSLKPDRDMVVTLQGAKTAMVLHRHLVNLEDPSPDDPLFSSAKGGLLSIRHVREIVSNAAETANVQPETPDGQEALKDVTPLELRHTAAYRRLQAGETINVVADRQRFTDPQLDSHSLTALADAATE